MIVRVVVIVAVRMIVSHARLLHFKSYGVYCPRLALLANRLASSAARNRAFALFDAFLLLEAGLESATMPAPSLHIHFAVLHQRGAQNDTGIHLARRGEIADAAGIKPALFLLQFVDDLHRPNFGRAGRGAGGKTRGERIERVEFRIEPADDIGDNVHDVAVALDGKLVVTFTEPTAETRPDIVAAEIEQHQMLGAFLRIGEQSAS